MLNLLARTICRFWGHRWTSPSTAFDLCERCGTIRAPTQMPRPAQLSPMELDTLQLLERSLSNRKGGEVWLVAYQPSEEKDGK